MPQETFRNPDRSTAGRVARTVYDVTPAELEHDERLLSLYRLWDSKRSARLMPARSDLPIEELTPWFGNLCIVDVLDGGGDFRYRLYGTTIAREAGFDMTGRLLSDYPIKPMIPFFGDAYNEIIRRKCAAFGEHNPGVDSVRRRRRLLLPFGADGQTVDKILSCNYAIDVVVPATGSF